ncbi:MAG: helix-turn-helix transcriptional regulator [Pseudonocardiaceae bacterium]
MQVVGPCGSRVNLAADIASSVRELLRLAALEQRSCSEVGQDARVPTVLLDVEVDGVRCVLQRVEPVAGHRSTCPLSPRESEIAQMVAEGHTNKAIASVLEISCWTVSSHLRRVFAKLDVRSRAAMVARLLEQPDLPSATGRVRPAPLARSGPPTTATPSPPRDVAWHRRTASSRRGKPANASPADALLDRPTR